MKVTGTALEGVVILEPDVFCDRRGIFRETFSDKEFTQLVAPAKFVQDNESRSVRGVVRGLHFQKGAYAQAKLVRVSSGRILDAAVDMRKTSPTFGKWVAVELSARNGRQLFIPRGFAHGFSVLTREAVVAYKCDNYYAPESDGGVRWNDPALGIDWLIDPAKAILSDKDAALPALADACVFD